jgi:hypothetical protein
VLVWVESEEAPDRVLMELTVIFQQRQELAEDSRPGVARESLGVIIDPTTAALLGLLAHGERVPFVELFTLHRDLVLQV